MRFVPDGLARTLKRKYWRMSGINRDAPVGIQLIQKLSNYCCPRLQINRLRWSFADHSNAPITAPAADAEQLRALTAASPFSRSLTDHSNAPITAPAAARRERLRAPYRRRQYIFSQRSRSARNTVCPHHH
ncbi:hypothetical protein HW555_012392 [Spodoptera exigua]|uniref:Uncharacterized protein n=1 Tax=Spodoptera exigua TaxID=7107 RepID=A0A835G758_SPOEX|nr:hypothetical protein HW555_012392 [Spodoptera exigua]